MQFSCRTRPRPPVPWKFVISRTPLPPGSCRFLCRNTRFASLGAEKLKPAASRLCKKLRKGGGEMPLLWSSMGDISGSWAFCTRMERKHSGPQIWGMPPQKATQGGALSSQSSSIVASGSRRIGMPLRIGYTRLHSLHFKASSPRSTRGLRHTGQASTSSSSGVIMAVILAR